MARLRRPWIRSSQKRSAVHPFCIDEPNDSHFHQSALSESQYQSCDIWDLAVQVIAAAKKYGLSIVSVLTTHNHWDHAGGNAAMKKLQPQYVMMTRVTYTRTHHW